MNGYYWIYLVCMGLLFWYESTGDREKRRLIYYGACSFLILMFVSQDISVSIDIEEYMRQYAIIPGLSFPEMLSHKFEIAYVLICWVIERLFASERVLLMAMAVLILVPFCRSFEKETDHPMLALMAFLALGMYLHTIIFWRQLVAMALLTYSYRYIRQRKLWKFLAWLGLAMCFHRASVVFAAVYVLYNFPIKPWVLAVCGGISAVLGFFGPEIIEFGITYIYPRYLEFPRLNMGGGTLMGLFWVVVLLSYWVFHDRLWEEKVRLPFLMLLIAATIQPICFAFYNWFRIVLFFRIALVPMTAQLYVALFRQRDNNPLLALAGKIGLRGKLETCYGKAWFPYVIQSLMFAVLFIWYVSELEGGVYIMAPI